MNVLNRSLTVKSKRILQLVGMREIHFSDFVSLTVKSKRLLQPHPSLAARAFAYC
jgi:hypothetical protein